VTTEEDFRELMAQTSSRVFSGIGTQAYQDYLEERGHAGTALSVVDTPGTAAG
jgi:hypothetical protein